VVAGLHGGQGESPNDRLCKLLRCVKALRLVPGATHLFEELGALDTVTDRGPAARAWGRSQPRDGAFLVASLRPDVRKRRIEGMKSSRWRWYLDEMFVKISGERHYLWRAVDHEGEVLESFVTKTRYKKTALKFLGKAMKKCGRADVLVTDKLRSYGAALRDLGAAYRQETGRWLNDRAENSHLPFRRRERAMLRFRRTRTLQKFTSVQASVTNHFNAERSLSSRSLFKVTRAAALAEWRGLCAG
jgi:putative transposase